MRALRRRLLQSKLVAVDNKPFTRKGVFGVCPGNFIEKVLCYAPVSMKELKDHKISYVNDNDYHLRIRIDETIVEFKPREGFPFFTKMVAKTVFEDFIRQARNLERSPARMLAFAMSNGFPVHTESSHKDNYSVRVKPSNFRVFKLLASVLDKKDIFWRGDYKALKVKSDYTQIEAIVEKIDPYTVISEDTGTANINPGFVTRSKTKHIAHPFG